MLGACAGSQAGSRGTVPVAVSDAADASTALKKKVQAQADTIVRLRGQLALARAELERRQHDAFNKRTVKIGSTSSATDGWAEWDGDVGVVRDRRSSDSGKIPEVRLYGDPTRSDDAPPVTHRNGSLGLSATDVAMLPSLNERAPSAKTGVRPSLRQARALKAKHLLKEALAFLKAGCGATIAGVAFDRPCRERRSGVGELLDGACLFWGRCTQRGGYALDFVC